MGARPVIKAFKVRERERRELELIGRVMRECKAAIGLGTQGGELRGFGPLPTS